MNQITRVHAGSGRHVGAIYSRREGRPSVIVKCVPSLLESRIARISHLFLQNICCTVEV